jgi:transcriptional regulator GlxA family with amidase domain
MPDLASVSDHRVVTVALAMAANLKHHSTIEVLAHSVNLGVNQLELLFRTEFKCSPMHYLSRLRLNHACFLLVNTELRVSKIMLKVGFTQPGYFSATFSTAFGCTPKEFRIRFHVFNALRDCNSDSDNEKLTGKLKK